MKKRWKIIGLIVLIIVVVLGAAYLFIWKYAEHKFGYIIELALKPAFPTLTAIMMYEGNEKTVPSDIDRLIPKYLSETPKDGWRTPYKLRKKGEKYILLSAGPDKEFNTKDDIPIPLWSTTEFEDIAIGNLKPIERKRKITIKMETIIKDLLEKEETHRPSMEIVFVEGPHNLFKSTQILFSVKNNTRKTLRDCRAVLYVYDEQKKEIFQSTDVLDTVSHWWKFDFISDRHLSIEEWNGVIKPKEKDYRLYFLFDTPNYFDTKEFKDKYGKAKYFVVQLYRQNELIDVMAKPNDFSSPVQK